MTAISGVQFSIPVQRSAAIAPEQVSARANQQQSNAEGLTEEEQKTVRELKQRDIEVRAHEQAHKSVGGPYAGAVSFETVTGPDGREYAVGGEVRIDAAPVRGDPEATIRKMEIVIRAALAPAEPSPQDVQVAAQAQQTKLQAQAELSRERAEEAAERRGDGGNQSGLLAALQAFSDAEKTTQQATEDITGILLDIAV
ncbi:MAG: hypothetical protein EP349_02420 [Alphaproteobacteria bacterium]|nr:MAG: hypothetical protein EP349_02420 [Alphaproteobacteria bacterium]